MLRLYPLFDDTACINSLVVKLLIAQYCILAATACQIMYPGYFCSFYSVNVMYCVCCCVHNHDKLSAFTYIHYQLL